VVVEKRRQAYLREIAAAYRDLVDARVGRMRVQVELAAEPDAAMRDEVTRTLEARFGRKVVATFRADPALIGGVIVRHGDLVMDGSLRRRAVELRRRLRATSLPALSPAA
jgi:F-type H+-transporting ATPase subunit delta